LVHRSLLGHAPAMSILSWYQPYHRQWLPPSPISSWQDVLVHILITSLVNGENGDELHCCRFAGVEQSTALITNRTSATES